MHNLYIENQWKSSIKFIKSQIFSLSHFENKWKAQTAFAILQFSENAYEQNFFFPENVNIMHAYIWISSSIIKKENADFSPEHARRSKQIDAGEGRRLGHPVRCQVDWDRDTWQFSRSQSDLSLST